MNNDDDYDDAINKTINDFFFQPNYESFGKEQWTWCMLNAT